MEPLLRFLMPASRDLDPEVERDRYRGALLGLAIGNALGVPVEGFSALDISSIPPDRLRVIRPEEADAPWDDDVAQAIELAECLLEGPLDADAYMARLLRWAAESGRGMGRQTYYVLVKARAGTQGTDAAREVWEESGRYAAGNGAVMRCAPVALRWRRDPVRLVEDAGHSARVTHYDPRCVWTTAATCAAIAHALAGTHWTLHELADGLDGVGAPEEVGEAVRHSATSDLGGLDLDESSSIGYTVRAMTAGLWALLNARDFETTLLEVIRAGGDTDTNGAVAGAVLGAKFGASAIPQRWIEGLPDPHRMTALADRLCEAAHC
ncbi:MAG: ADP-ribosylglycohydrolase family protein [Gemmatimonadota bacterium]|nr:MAG: ADP-ribosylglycohydrolase family protein [Gemmatimonadota bacterium]